MQQQEAQKKASWLEMMVMVMPCGGSSGWFSSAPLP